MLGGLAPVLIFHFPTLFDSVTNALQGLNGIPYVGKAIADNLGTPIPIYLDKNLSGIVIMSESQGLDVQEDTQPRNDNKPPIVNQKGLNSLVTIEMSAQKDSIVLSAIQSFADIIFSKVVSRNYSISYLSGSNTVFNGLLHQFQTQTNSENDLVQVTMQISKANQKSPTPEKDLNSLTRVVADVPTGVST